MAGSASRRAKAGQGWQTWAVAGAVACYAALAVGDGLNRLSANRLSANQLSLARYVPEFLHSEALNEESLMALSKGDAKAGEALARRAMQIAPLDARSSAMLGTARLMLGDAQGAEAAFTYSAQRGWRAAPTQTYWLQRAWAMGDYRVAGLRMDALLRLHPASINNHALFDPLEQDPAMREVMAERLSLNPNWAQVYTRDVIGLADQRLAARVDVLARLAQKGGSLGCGGVQMVINQLTGRNQIPAAIGLWRAHCPAAAKGLIGDPDFREFHVGRDGLTEFSWNSDSSGDIGLRQDARGLQVNNSGSLPAAFLRQKLVLPQGRYRLTWTATGADAQGNGAIVPYLGCDATAAEALPATPNGKGTWQAEVNWDGRCPGVWLKFVIKPQDGMVSFAQPRLLRAN
ncbi:hypothetical protein EOE18_09520 [Novosphingobium umbonatum]|uniref:Tetratricopeptide repeat protein n=1 Tax=Novosphingobium umbonatum TaxID=1908524 RepID=A0A3S2URE2_9SPHN|nr:hypothetical protein [Novosphingobium umbonatum]RVU04971.1 hypothetical protein EOE18_09520 [Novosphingobium umbonatum]